jgi:hypothetical protein
MSNSTDRRRFMGSAMVGAAGAGAFLSLEEWALKAALEADQPPVQPRAAGARSEDLSCGRIGGLQISRLMLGGNLIGGYAHSRDLIYVSRLLREYNTESKIFETFEIAEAAGINMIQVAPSCVDFVCRYRKQRGGRLQMMVCVDADQTDRGKVRSQVHELIDKGVETLYTHGEVTDRRVMMGDLDSVGRTVELIREAGVPAGIGSHSLETPIASEKARIEPDYYVKTLHPDTYWSATPVETREEWCWYHGKSQDHDRYHDNIFCLDPDRTVEFMRSVAKPWVAFKVMAAGAVPAQVGFHYAFRNGADFIIAGMFDFQVEEDVAIAVKALRRSRDRERPWFS